MTSRWGRRVVIALIPFAVILAITSLVLNHLRPSFDAVADASLEDVLWIVTFVGFLITGCLVALRMPRNPLAWVLIIMGLGQTVAEFVGSYAVTALLWLPTLPWGEVASWITAWIWPPSVTLFPIMVLLFPTGRLPSPRWRWVVAVAILGTAFFITAGLSLWPYRGTDLLEGGEEVSTPLVDLTEIVFPIIMLCLIASLVSLIYRFRRAHGVERQQLKWLAYASAIGVVTIVFDVFIVDGLLDIQEGPAPTIAGILSSPIVFVVAIAIAIFRYRIFEIDLIINRTLVYGLLTAVLGALYVGIVGGVGSVAGDSNLTVAAATLAVAGLFQPLRRRIQAFIDHRFYRRKYDAQRTIDAFAAHLRDEVDLESLTRELVTVIDRTMQPRHLTIWIPSERAQ